MVQFVTALLQREHCHLNLGTFHDKEIQIIDLIYQTPQDSAHYTASGPNLHQVHTRANTDTRSS